MDSSASGSSTGSASSTGAKANADRYEGTISPTVEWTNLSTRALAIAATLALPLSQGYSRAELARYYGKSELWVSQRLDELEREVAAQLERPE
jgi:hypothetical protein